MKRTLVVYFSRTSYTRRIAEEVARLCNADLEEITERRSRTGLAAYIRSAYEALSAKPVAIDPAKRTPASYDRVIFGTPIWVGRISSPVLGYLQAHKDEIKEYAVFCTMGGSNPSRALAQFRQITGKPPFAVMSARDADIDAGRHQRELQRFAAAISEDRNDAARSGN